MPTFHNDMDATLMSPRQHQSGIHVVGNVPLSGGSGCPAEVGAGALA